MTPDKGKGLGVLVDKPAKAEDEAPDYEAGKAAAAQAVIDAVSGGDAAAVSSALTDFVNLCM